MWHPINTIPKDGNNYCVIRGMPNNEEVFVVTYVTEPSRELGGYWVPSSPDMDYVWEHDELVRYFIYWTELPKD